MSSSTDYIPQEVKIDIDKAFYLDDVKNFADKKEKNSEELIGHIKQSITEYDARFVSQRQEWAEDSTGLWNQMDAAFRSFVNDNSVQAQKKYGANEPNEWERAKVGTTQFYRQVTQMAANGYAVQTSKDMPFKYEALHDNDIDSTPEQAQERADRLNLLAKWSMKKDRFNLKSIDFWTQVKKYGNIPVMVEWKHVKGTKQARKTIFKIDKPTEIDHYEFEDVETAIENRPEFTVLPIESVKADTIIGDIQRQECVIVSSVVGMSSIIDGIRAGFYRDDMIADLGRSHQWDGYSGFDNEDEKKENRGFDNDPSGANTGQYLKREVFINAPIDEENGTWSPLGNIPKRYRVTMFGNNPTNTVIARIERNQEPDDAIPIKMIHANPDDTDFLYHISNYEVIRPNLSTETTLIRQIIDNNTLVCKPPLMEVAGEVQGNNREFGADARFIVDNVNSIGQFTIRDISQPTLGVLEYMKQDSNTANSIDKNMLGESFGARTSASEAGTISANSRRPNLVNIEYVLEQLLGFVAHRYLVLWEAYGLPSQVIQITDSEDKMTFIRPTDVSGEFDIVIDIVNDIKDNTAEANKMIAYTQAIANTPMAETTDWAGLNEVLAEKMMGTSKFTTANQDGDALANAKNNIVLMIGSGLQPQFAPGMNLKKHLSLYKEERMRWKGHEEENPNVEGVLDVVIEQLEQQISQPPQQQQQQQSPVVSEGEAQRQAISGAAGGIG